jgi:hypothetical protein
MGEKIKRGFFMKAYDTKEEWLQRLYESDPMNKNPISILSDSLGQLAFDPSLLRQILSSSSDDEHGYYLYLQGNCLKGFAIAINEEDDDDVESEKEVSLVFAADPVIAKKFFTRLQKTILKEYDNEVNKIRIDVLAPNNNTTELLVHEMGYRYSEDCLTRDFEPQLKQRQRQWQKQRQMQQQAW